MLAGGSTSYVVGSTGPAMTGMAGMSGPAGSSAVGGVVVLSLALGVLAMAVAELRLVGANGPVQVSAGRPMLAPRCAAGCRVAMGVTMALALLTMV